MSKQINRQAKDRLYYYLSVEGETEELYFLWLEREINACSDSKYNVRFCCNRKKTLSSIIKDNNDSFKKIGGVCSVYDIEDYNDEHIRFLENKITEINDFKINYEDILNKQLKKQLKKHAFNVFIGLGYSNYCFEIWIISHFAAVKPVMDRSKYLVQINKVTDIKFESIDQYKMEKNFKRLLKKLSLDKVIRNAIPNCEIIEKNNEENYSDKRVEYRKFIYYQNNPDISLHRFIKTVLQKCCLI